MCGRIVQAFPESQLADFFGPFVGHVASGPRYNAAPTQDVAVIRDLDGVRHLDSLRWGLLPHWTKDPGMGSKLINARAETLEERPAFREAFKGRRCIVPVSGFYEWQPTGKGRQPLYFHAKSGQPLALAGLWETWRDPSGAPIETCTVITTAPNDLMRPVHDRMPTLLRREDVATWLDPKAEPKRLHSLLVPYGGEDLTAYAVSRAVNSVKNDSPECIRPEAEAQQRLL